MKLFAICNFFIFSLCFNSVYGSFTIRSFMGTAALNKLTSSSFTTESIRRASSHTRTKVPFNSCLDHDVYGNDRLSYIKAIAVFNPELSKVLSKSFSVIGRTPIDSFSNTQSEELSLDASRLKLARSLYKKGAMPLSEITKHFGFSEAEITR